jgi:hypothetical protein
MGSFRNVLDRFFCWATARRQQPKSRHAPWQQYRRLELELLEDRLVCTGPTSPVPSPSPDFADIGIIAQNPLTGNWQATRFDGTSYVNEQLGNWSVAVDRKDILIGDINGDGRAELVGRDKTIGMWYSLRFTGSDYISTPLVNWGTSAQYFNVQLADVNGDGKMQIIGRSSLGYWLATTATPQGGYYNQTLGFWNPTISWQNVMVGDLDGDGRTDIVGRDPASGCWYWLHFDGSQYRVNQIAQWDPTLNYTDVQIGDVNGDGRSDIIGRGSDGTWWATMYDGSSFSNQKLASWNPKVLWQNILVGDIFGDGRAAILGRNPDTGNWQAIHFDGSKYQNHVIASWTTDVTYDVRLADINGDGRQDVIGRNSGGDWYAITFDGNSFANNFLTSWYPASWQVFTADLNDDGITDIVGWDPKKGDWWVASGNGTAWQSFQIASGFFSYNFADVRLGDINGDGHVGILGREPGSWNWFVIDFNGVGYERKALGTLAPAANVWKYVQVADINGDGDADLIAYNAATGNWWATIYDGTRYTSQIIGTWDPGINWQTVLIGDLNGDGRADVMGRDPVSGDWYAIEWNGASFTTIPRFANWAPGYRYSFVRLLDVNGDGRADIVGLQSTGAWLAIIPNGPNYDSTLLGVWNTPNMQVVTGDVNGDGRDDILGFDPETGNWWMTSSNGSAYVTQWLAYWNTANTYSSFQILDINGDGRQDVVALDSTGSWWALMFSATGSHTQFLRGWYPANWQGFTGDINGDGKDDLLAMDPATGNWVVVYFDGSQYRMQRLPTWNPAIHWQNLNIVDMNADGREDIIGLDPSSNTWYAIQFDGATYQSNPITSWASSLTWTNVLAGDVPGVSNASLRRRILEDTPDLREALADKNTLMAARLLLNWTANAGNYALDGSLLIYKATSAADYFYNFYLPDKGGNYCGGYAYFYSGILNLFGIDALQMGFGSPTGDLTHATVVVPIWDGVTYQYYIFDPTFNCTFRDASTGDYLTVFDLFDYLQGGRVNDIAVESQSLATRTWLATSPVASPNLILTSVTAGLCLYRWPDYGLNSYLQTWGPLFTANGYSAGVTGFIQLMEAHIFGVYPSLSSAAAQQFIAMLQARGIPCPG